MNARATQASAERNVGARKLGLSASRGDWIRTSDRPAPSRVCTGHVRKRAL